MNERFPNVWTIVLTFNGKSFLDGCLGTLTEASRPGVHFLLVDNGSTDDSVEYVHDHYAEVEVLSLGRNQGIAVALNRGLEYAMDQGAEFLVLCNDDIEAPDPRWLQCAIDAFQTDSLLGVVGFVEVNPPGQVELPETIELQRVDYMNGFAIVIRRSVLDHVGLFDVAYNGGYEEDDLEARILAAGYRMKQASVQIFHYAGGTKRKYRLRSSYLQMRNGLRFSIKNRGLFRSGLRALRMLDVACNPWPLTYDSADQSHQQIRLGGNMFQNGAMWLAAVGWNLIALPQTLRSRRQARQRIRSRQPSLGTVPAVRHDPQLVDLNNA